MEKVKIVAPFVKHDTRKYFILLQRETKTFIMMEYIKLYNGVEMPTLGYGVFLESSEECERCVTEALSTGYRLIDTAQAYYNG